VTEDTPAVMTFIRGFVAAHGRLSLATQGLRIWSEALPYTMDGEEIVCRLEEGSPSLSNIRLNPRVAFCIGEPGETASISGSGIALVSPGDGVVTIRGYRFAARSWGTATPERAAERAPARLAVVEKRKLQWQAADPRPPAAGAPSGFAQKIAFWLKASRAVSFPLSALPVALGTVLALLKGSFDPVTFLLALVGGVAAHAGVNLVSDFNDFRRGVDTTDALSSHPGALVDEVVQPERVLIASMFMFLVAAVSAALLLPRAGYVVIGFAVVGLLGGFFYTGGSVGYKYRGWGELPIALLMGPLMVVGAYVVQTGRVDLLPFLLSACLGSLVGSVTLANNMRDVHDDRRAGIFTLPMGLRVPLVKRIYVAMLALPFAIVAGVVILHASYLPMLLVLLSTPMAVKAIGKVWKAGDTPEEVRAHAAEGRYPLNSIKLHLRFSLLLIIGSALVPLLAPLLAQLGHL
jgi:1,4-dihydroxy-2-naphthoate octaprenyltransferase